jgi:hypothetical protein
MRATRAFVCVVSFAVALLVPLFCARDARAYTWMIRHGYSGCMPCHTDPSGAGPLTAYGRAQGELLLQTRYGAPTEEASSLSGFAWGLVPLPDELRLGGDFREAYFGQRTDGSPYSDQFLTMQADLFGDIKFHRFRAEGDIAFAPLGDLQASLTRAPTNNLISRDHWLGYELDEDASWLVRAGRITLPFGIRNLEHTLFARNLTRTDIDRWQQYGAAISVSKEKFRGELMGIAGNFQLRPDDYRERGYSTFFEYAPMNTLALGASSLFTHAERDFNFSVTNNRFANGLFARYAPIQQLVLLAEGDWVYQALKGPADHNGYATFAQADVEPVQGVHVMLTGELMNSGAASEAASYNGWLSAVWFFWSHMDVRVDGVAGVLGSPVGTANVLSLLLQYHVYL